MKRENRKRLGSLTVTLAASLATVVAPALTGPSAAGVPGAQAPVPGAQAPIPGAQSPIQGAQQPFSSPVDVLLDGLLRLDPRDIALAGPRSRPILLWRNQPVTFVDVEDVLTDRQIDILLNALDDDPVAGDTADSLTGFLYQVGILPRHVDVVGLDLIDSPPAIFVLPD